MRGLCLTCGRPEHARGLCTLHYQRDLHERRKTNRCACGCGALCRYEFISGHNTRLMPPEEQRRRGRKNDGSALRGTGAGLAYRRRLKRRHEHRVVAAEKLGRQLRRKEIVHHVNGDHLDNRPENLEVMTQAEHVRTHAAERRRRGA